MAEPRIGAKMMMDSSHFVRGLNQAESRAKVAAGGIKTAFAGVGTVFGAVGVGSFVAGIRSATDEFSRLYDLARRSKSDFGEFQKVFQAFNEGGVQAEAFGNALSKLEKKISDAKQGNKTYAKAFEDLGMTMGDVSDTGLAAILQISDAVKESGNSAQSLSAIFTLLEEQGAQFRDVMAQGADAIRDVGDEINALTKQEIKLIKEADAAWTRFGQRRKTILAQITVGGVAMGKLAGGGTSGQETKDLGRNVMNAAALLQLPQVAIANKIGMFDFLNGESSRSEQLRSLNLQQAGIHNQMGATSDPKAISLMEKQLIRLDRIASQMGLQLDPIEESF